VRVLIDARSAVHPRRTGVGHYTDQITRHLPGAAADVDFVAWYVHLRAIYKRRRFFVNEEAPNLAEHPMWFPRRIHQPLSLRFRLPLIEWTSRFDVLFATNYFPPPTNRGEVVTVIHDLGFERFPQTAPHVDEGWRRLLRRAIERSRALIVPSKATAHDLRELHGVDGARIVVIPHGVNADDIRAVPQGAGAAIRRRLHIDRRFVLWVGGLEPRKNLERLVSAFADVDSDAMLVLAGGPVPWYPELPQRLRTQIQALPPATAERVVMAGYVGMSEKRALLSEASVVAYPSIYEGFGFPVLEAMAARVPVLTSNVSSLPEVAGDAAYLVDPNDEHQIARGLEALLGDEDLRDRLIGAGLARAARFTWHETARRTATVLREAGGDGR
jgi:glycosyltransferase involved in cell wall biosynthesis